MDKNHEVKGVVFDTDSYRAVKFYRETNTPKIIKLVLKYSGGFIKNETQANSILLIFVVLAMGLSIFLFWKSSISPQKSSNLLPGQIKEQIEQMPLNN